MEFVVVGMAAGVLRGAPEATVDLDIVHRRSPANVARVPSVLAEVDAVYRHDPRSLRPDESHLMSSGHQLLTTTHGDLDCLGAIDEGKGYEALRDVTTKMELGGELSVQVLTLRALIGIKERSARPKDLAVLPVLRATLEESERGS